MRKNNFIFGLAFVLLMTGFCFPDEMIQPQRIVNCHTAGLLPKGTYSMECSVYPDGILNSPGSGMLLFATVGLLNRLNIGVGYGGDGIIGREDPTFNPHIGALIKYRLFEETYFGPALAIGYDHQGIGGIDRQYNGYVFKSPGFFLAASKNYLMFTKVQLGLHCGMNYSFEERQTVKWPNAYAGIDMAVNEELAFACEYDMALNSRDPGPELSNYDNPFKGFLNAGVKWAFSPSFFIEFDIKDMLQYKVDLPSDDYPSGRPYGWDREIKVGYIQHF
ncbi:MAG TPA: hypothetical protein DCO75_07670 [Fibrobacteres bacterium]|nr:hypothetical protein [Fibrobacterota bacterium]